MNTKRLILNAIITLSLVGCGGGGSESPSPPPDNDLSDTTIPANDANPDQKGQMIGMQGLRYTVGDTSGTTDENGGYTYAEGQPISFYVGDILLGTTHGKADITLADLAQGNAATEENLTRFLLTLDYDLAPMNGVSISESIHAAAVGKQLDFTQDTVSFKTAAEQVLDTELASDLHIHALHHSLLNILPQLYAEKNTRAAKVLLQFRYPQTSSATKALFPDIESEASQVFELLLQDTVLAGDSPLEYIFKATNTPLILDGEEGSLRDLYIAYKQRVQAIGPDAVYVEREDLVARPASLDNVSDVLQFAVMSDFQIRDDESPLNVNPVKFLIPSAWYPAGASVAFQVDDMVRTLRHYETQVHKPIEHAVFTGDFTDISQYNEVRTGLDVLDGNQVNPDSGNDDDPIAGNFADGKPNDTFDAFDALGLNASSAEQADIPWYYVAGNHDGLMLGNFPITDKPLRLFGKEIRGGTREFYDNISTGTNNWFGYDPSVLGFIEHLFDPQQFYVVADADRRVVNPRQIAEEMFNSSSQPHGHGMQNVIDRVGDLEGRLHHTFTSNNGLVKHIALDTNMPIGPEGWLDLYDLAWLKQELQAAEDNGQLVIVSSHHKPDNIIMNGSLLVDTLNQCPNVIAHLVAHSHLNNIRARPGKENEHGYWEIESGSMVNWPQQFRILDIQVDATTGVGVIKSTMLNHVTESPLYVAQRGRFLAYLERYLEGAPYSDEALTGAEGDADDRNAMLYFNVPAGVMAKR